MTGVDASVPELADREWLYHARAFAAPASGRWPGGCPALVREAVALAWAASRRDTVAAIGLNLAAGVMTTSA